METLSLLLLFTIIAVGAWLSIWVLFSNKKSIVNQTFVTVSILILLWNIFGYEAYRATDSATALQYFRLNYMAVALFFVAFYYLTIHFPVVSKSRNGWLDYFVIIAGIVFAAAAPFSELMIKSLQFGSGGELTLRTGLLGDIFYPFTVIITIYTVTMLIKKYATLTTAQKYKTKILIFGIILFALFNLVFNVLFFFIYPENYRYTQLGDFSAIFFMSFAAYAILKNQLFDIRIIATEALVIVLSLALFIQILISPNNAIEVVIRALVWFVATYGGYRLVGSVKVEIKQKEAIAKLAKDLEKANSHLKELDAAKDNFISMASHELNTPIAAIEGYLSMILDEGIGGGVDGKVRHYLENVYVSSKRLAALVKDLLNVSRIESGRIHLIYAQQSIESVIDQSISEIAIKAEEVGHELVYDRPKHQIPLTWFDAPRITEVMINLIGNAIKYTDPGGKIIVRSKVEDGKILVSVKDNGRGIPEEKKKGVFEKFVQVDVLKDEVKGSGLGLFITKNLVELHRGKIWFESQVGKGTTFYFTLPLLENKPKDMYENEGPVLQLK